MEQNLNAGVSRNGALLLTDRLKDAWKNFMEEFQQSFDFNQLDSVLSLLREFYSTSVNPTKKNRLELVQKGDGESENNNDYSSSLEKKVFGNHLLAKTVFKCLSHSDLFSCRLMNSYWNENATEILLKRDFKVEFQRKFNRFYLTGSNWKSLDMFTEFLKQSKNFPCNKFMFTAGNLGNDDAQRFFSFYGSSIKSIEICFDDGRVYNKNLMDEETGFSPHLTDSRVIGMILSRHLPNLEELDLDLTYDGDSEWSRHEPLLFPLKKEVKLPNLKTLVYDSFCQGDDVFLRQLLVAATNLERFEFKDDFFVVRGLNDFFATGKVKCISDLFFPSEAEELEKLEEMVKHEPKLTLLNLGNLTAFYSQSETWNRISIILTKLLESCKKSISQIHFFKSLGFLRHLQIPVLENVTDFCLEVITESAFNIEDVHDYSFAFLPRGATFSRNFPRLKSVTLSLNVLISGHAAADWWTKCFPTDEIVCSVKYLNLFNLCPFLWMRKLSQMFPNLEDLSVSNIKDFPKFSQIIWASCRKLKSLEIGIDLSSPLNSHPALDSGFTGISPEVCKKLRSFSPSLLESMAESYMENDPSLLDLTDLQSLRINLDFSMSLTNYKYPKILSPLSGICVFKPLKKLREVNIKCATLDDQQLDESSILQNLTPLTPYKVKIDVNQ